MRLRDVTLRDGLLHTAGDDDWDEGEESLDKPWIAVDQSAGSLGCW